MSFFEELKRRNVVRVGVAYAVIGWVLAQVAEFAFENFGAPDWALKSFVVVLLLGLPLALFFAWAFEMTPEGLKREKDVDRGQSITANTGRKLDRVIMGVLSVGILVLLADKFLIGTEQENPVVDAQVAENLADVEIVATGKSIAVLPFVNMSDDADYFADGLSEELLNLLAKMPDLKVAGRTSSFVFKGKTEDLRAIGEALGVSTVLEGSVRRSGERLRITAQLINVDNGFHLWSETYDRQMADIFDIQDDVASAISGALRLQLSPQTKKPTSSSAAYALYLEALPHIASNSEENSTQIVVDLLDRAITLDPGFAKAYEARALAHWMSAGDFMDATTARQIVFDAANKALQLDPDLVVARMYAGLADPDLVKRADEFFVAQEGIGRAPDNFDVLRAWCYELMSAGYLREATHCTARMVELEPLSSLGYYRSALLFSAAGRRDEALASFSRAAELGGSGYQWDIMFSNLVSGDVEAAEAILDELRASDLKLFYSWNSENLRQVVAGTSDPEMARSFLRDWVKRTVAEAPSFVEEGTTYTWYLAFGDIDAYWDAINDYGLAQRFQWTNNEFLRLYGIAFPDNGFLRHPAFLEYAKITGLTDLWDKRGPPDFCSKIDGSWTCK